MIRRGLVVLAAGVLWAPAAQAAPSCGSPAWQAAWTAPPSTDDGSSSGPDGSFEDHPVGFVEQSVRMIVTPHVAGGAVRLRFSNHFGRAPMRIADVHVGAQGAGAAVAGANPAVRFGGVDAVSIPAGAEATSDPVALPVAPWRRLAISFYLPGASGRVTMHNLGRQTSFLTAPGAGDHAGDADGAAFTQTTVERLLLDAVDVESAAPAGVVVAVGDSITDGDGSSFDADARWPDDLSRRLLAAGSGLSVVDAGIAANEVTADATVPGGGPSLEERFGRDVLEQSGVTDVIVQEGINDIGFRPDASAGDIIAGLANVAARGHAAGLRVIGATLLPFEGSMYYSAAGDAKRAQVNAWIRSGGGGAYDGVADFDAAVHDPQHPARMLPAYDSGDHLHPDDAGYRAVAASVDLALLHGRACATATRPRSSATRHRSDRRTPGRRHRSCGAPRAAGIAATAGMEDAGRGHCRSTRPRRLA